MFQVTPESLTNPTVITYDSSVVVTFITTFYYAVTAINTNGESMLSEVKSITITPSNVVVTVPSAPVISITAKTIVVTTYWEITCTSTSPISSSILYKSSQPFSSINDPGVIGFTYFETTESVFFFATSVEGYYRVIVSNNAGRSVLSNIVSTYDAGTIEEPPTSVPGIPNLLNPVTGSINTPYEIMLTFGGVEGITSYYVYRSTSSFSDSTKHDVEYSTSLYSNDPTIIFFDMVDVISTTTFYYGVTAVNEAGESVLSSVKTITIIVNSVVTIPSSPVVYNQIITPNILLWNTVPGATSYKVYHSSSSFMSVTGTMLFWNIDAGTKTSFEFMAPFEGYYRIVAINSAGTSALSNQMFV